MAKAILHLDAIRIVAIALLSVGCSEERSRVDAAGGDVAARFVEADRPLASIRIAGDERTLAELMPKAPPVATIYGFVRAPNNAVGTYIVSLGAKQGAKPGAQCVVRRRGAIVTTLLIDKVYADWSCAVVQSGTPRADILPGDDCEATVASR
jgi:hypothetical protein